MCKRVRESSALCLLSTLNGCPEHVKFLSASLSFLSWRKHLTELPL